MNPGKHHVPGYLSYQVLSQFSSDNLSTPSLHNSTPQAKPMDSFTAIIPVFTTQPSVEVPSDLETGGGSGNGAYCVIA
ncbi:fungal mating-type pheromone [Coprinopsis cinerea AmutBmut pab1-1]|nr:fungal mating-type pheromone [Coprinopsis cinerea AmutBmut pab1-1]